MLKSKTLEKRHKYRELIEQTTEEEFVIAERIFKEIYKLFKISKSSIRWGGYLYQRELKYVFVRIRYVRKVLDEKPSSFLSCPPLLFA
jgi:predicted metal-dependent hydrolase